MGWLGTHAHLAAGRDSTEAPRAGGPEAARCAEGVLQERHVADLAARGLREQRERRRDLLAERASLVGEASEHRDVVIVGDHVSDLERLRLPDPADTIERIDNALRTPVRARPRKHLVKFGIVKIERYVG